MWVKMWNTISVVQSFLLKTLEVKNFLLGSLLTMLDELAYLHSFAHYGGTLQNLELTGGRNQVCCKPPKFLCF